jgi:hypothetical protein
MATSQIAANSIALQSRGVDAPTRSIAGITAAQSVEYQLLHQGLRRRLLVSSFRPHQRDHLVQCHRSVGRRAEQLGAGGQLLLGLCRNHQHLHNVAEALNKGDIAWISASSSDQVMACKDVVTRQASRANRTRDIGLL